MESPRWLLLSGAPREEAVQALTRARGKYGGDTAAIEKEATGIQRAVQNAETAAGGDSGADIRYRGPTAYSVAQQCAEPRWMFAALEITAVARPNTLGTTVVACMVFYCLRSKPALIPPTSYVKPRNTFSVPSWSLGPFRLRPHSLPAYDKVCGSSRLTL